MAKLVPPPPPYTPILGNDGTNEFDQFKQPEVANDESNEFDQFHVQSQLKADTPTVDTVPPSRQIVGDEQTPTGEQYDVYGKVVGGKGEGGIGTASTGTPADKGVTINQGAVPQQAQQAQAIQGRQIPWQQIGQGVMTVGRNLAAGAYSVPEDIGNALGSNTVAEVIGNALRHAVGKPPINLQQAIGAPNVQEAIAGPTPRGQEGLAGVSKFMGQLVGGAIVNPIAPMEAAVTPLISKIIQNPTVQKVVADAIVGGVAAPVFGYGARQSYHQPTTPGQVAGEAATGATLGATLRTIGNLIGGKTAAETAAQPTQSAELSQGQFAEVWNAANRGNEQAQQMLEQHINARNARLQAEIPKKVPAPAKQAPPLAAPPPPSGAPEMQAIADKYGISVPQGAAQGLSKDTTQAARESVPHSELQDYDPETGKTTPYDSSKGARSVIWKDGREYIAINHATDPGHATVGRRITMRGHEETAGTRRANGIADMQEGRSIAQKSIAEKQGIATPEQTASTQNAYEHVRKGQTPNADQANTITATAQSAAKRAAAIQHLENADQANTITAMAQSAAKRAAAIQHLENGDLAAAAKASDEADLNSWRGVTVVNPFTDIKYGKLALTEEEKRRLPDIIAGVRQLVQQENILDTIGHYDATLAKDLRQAEASEARAMAPTRWRDPKFDQESRQVIKAANPAFKEAVTATDILHSPEYDHWTPADRQGVAEAITLRGHLQDLVDNAADMHGADSPLDFKGNLKQYADNIWGKKAINPNEGTDPSGTGVIALTRQIAAGFFQKNLRFTELVGTHGPQMGGPMWWYGKALALSRDPDLLAAVGTNPLTKDFRSQFTGQPLPVPFTNKPNQVLTGALNKVTSILPKAMREFSVPEANAQGFALGKLLQNHSLADVRAFGREIRTGKLTLSSEKRAQMALDVYIGVENGLGTAGSISRNYIQKGRMGQILQPLQGYTSGLTRLYVKNTAALFSPKSTLKERAIAGGTLTSLITARALLGGSQLPPEIQEPMDIWIAKYAPADYLAMKYAMKDINLPRMANADISQHTSAGLKIGSNLVIPQVQAIIGAGNKGDIIKAGARVAGMLGGPVGAIAGKSVETTEKYMKDEERIPVYMRSGEFGTHPVTTGYRHYDEGNALRDNLLMGQDTARANFEEKQRIIWTLKQAGHKDEIPYKQLDEHFPSPGIVIR